MNMTLKKALRYLGDTPDEIAETLTTEKIKGRPLSTQHDPIANFLRELFDQPEVHVEHAYISVVGMEMLTDVPKPIQEFIGLFDNGAYPDLVEDDETPRS